MRIFNSNVKSVLLYGFETWRKTEVTQRKIQTFINSCLMRIFNIIRPVKVSNEDLWSYTQKTTLQHHTTDIDIEPAGEKEEWPTQKQMEDRHRGRI